MEQMTIVAIILGATGVVPRALQLIILKEVIPNNIKRATVLSTYHAVRQIFDL
jgi:hypothetical protein